MKKYLITSREFYTDTPAVFRKILQEQFIQHLPDYALYRDKVNPHYAIQAEHFVEVCRNFEGIKSLIHGDISLAKELGAYGVHLTSKQFDKIAEAKESGLYVVVSTHTQEEVLEVQNLGADAVTYSPIFASPNKGEPKGLKDLQECVAQSKINVFALGGVVDEEHIKLLEDTNVYGFASIRYFY